MHILVLCNIFWPTQNIMCNSLHNNGLHFNVSSLQNASELYISNVPRDDSHLQLCVRWQTYWRYFQIVCYNTQAMPLFQALNFLYVTLVNARFLKWCQVFWKICGPQPQCVHVIHLFKRTHENNMQTFMVCWVIDVLEIFKTCNFPYMLN